MKRQVHEAAYGDTLDVAKYIGAPSLSTGRRWVDELVARGLPVYTFGKRRRFKFSEVDAVVARLREE
jgi:hypothetical protein